MKACYKPSLLLSLLITAFAFPAMSAIPPMSTGPVVRPNTVSSPVAVPSHLRYQTPISLGSLSGPTVTPYSVAFSINNKEQIVGVSATPVVGGFSYSKAFVWQNNVMTLVPPTGSVDQFRDLRDINNSGLAAGTDLTGTAYTYQNGALTILPNLSANNKSFAYGISDTGKIVGTSMASDGKFHAVAWQNGTVTNIGMLSGYIGGEARGISDSGAFIVGGTQGSPPVIWNQNNNTISALDTTNALYSFATAVNNSGVAVGAAFFLGSPSGTSHVPTRWVNGKIEKLDNAITLGRATAINNHGQIVGLANAIDAFLWDNGTFYYLNDLIPPNSGWFITQAYGINDRGEIVGSGIFNGQELGFLLKPKQ